MQVEVIKETLVVEGKDDESAVKKAVSCDVIITHGFGISEKTFRRIEAAQAKTGVIVFTDPDHAGEQIRARITKRVPGCKHAFLPREQAECAGDIGIENASPEHILNALKQVRTPKKTKDPESLFTKSDMVMYDLIGSPQSSDYRAQVGKILGIGYGNGKQFLSRLNHYDITRQELESAVVKVLKKGEQ